MGVEIECVGAPNLDIFTRKFVLPEDLEFAEQAPSKTLFFGIGVGRGMPLKGGRNLCVRPCGRSF